MLLVWQKYRVITRGITASLRLYDTVFGRAEITTSKSFSESSPARIFILGVSVKKLTCFLEKDMVSLMRLMLSRVFLSVMNSNSPYVLR